MLKQNNSGITIYTITAMINKDGKMRMKKALLLGLIVLCILFAGCIEWGGGQEKETPTAHAVVYFSDGEYHVEITKISHNTTVSGVKYFVKDSNNDVAEYGGVEDIYSKEVNGVFFQDGDMDGMLSAGDSFVIKHINNSGSGEDNGKLVLKYTMTGKTILDVPLNE